MTDEQTTTLPALTLSDAEIKWRLDERQAAALGRANEAVPKAYRGKPGDIVAVWMMADELGVARMAMLRNAYVINGKPQLNGDLMLAIARQYGVKVAESMSVDEETGELAATCKAILPHGESVEVTFSQSDAMAAGLWGSSDAWRKYPKRMLQMRARGWCLRDAIPHKLAGCYVEGELQEPEMRDITPGGEQ